jgi:hypothetical protein
MHALNASSLVLSLVLGGCSAGGGPAAIAPPAAPPAAAHLPSNRVVAPFDVLAADGSAYSHPFLGGFDVPRPQLVDIDGDGDADLFVQEYTGSAMYLENVGGAGAAEFVWRTDQYGGLDVGEWYRFADVDGDGDFDLLTEQPYSYVRYYRNDGTPAEPDFVLAADTLRDASGEPIFSDRQNIPNVTDIDCDGLADLFIGRIDGTIMRYEAVAAGPEPAFRLVTDRFEDIEIVAQFGQPGNVSVPMPNIPGGIAPERGPSAREPDPGILPTGRGSRRHGANTMTFADIDGDGDMDLFWGDFFEPSLLRIENTGSCSNPVLRGEPEPFPPPDPIQSSGYNAPTFGDVDEDGTMDLLVGVLGGAFNPNRTAHANLYFYEQLSEEHFELRSRRLLDQIDAGSESYPVFADLDADGDDDLLVANKISARDPRTSVLLRLEHVGDGYQVRDSMSLLASYNYAPAVADLDGDADQDMLLGTWNDGIAYYRNEGTPERARFTLLEAGFVELTRGSHATPALVDIDADGDLDLFVGETSGTINYYENTGDANTPIFTLVSDEYADINVGRRSVPVFLDVDADGDEDMIIGSESRGLLLYRNEGNAQDPVFERGVRLPHEVPAMAAPAFGDPDGDGALELIVGGLGGGLIYFDGT